MRNGVQESDSGDKNTIKFLRWVLILNNLYEILFFK